VVKAESTVTLAALNTTLEPVVCPTARDRTVIGAVLEPVIGNASAMMTAS
jgi:hypothetical protein